MPRKNNKKKQQQQPDANNTQDGVISQQQQQTVQEDGRPAEKDQADDFQDPAFNFLTLTNNTGAAQRKLSTSLDKPRKESYVGILNTQQQSEVKTSRKKVSEEQFMRNEHLEELSLKMTIAFFFRHSIRDIKRRKFHYSLAFCSVFIVVLSCLVINTVVEKGPIIFLRLAESHHGEMDGMVLPFGERDVYQQNNGLFLNYTRVIELYGKEKFNLSPRKYIHSVTTVFEHSSGLYDAKDEKAKHQWFNTFDKQLRLPKREDVYRANFKNIKSMQNKILTIDTEREKEIDLGRDYSNPPMELGQCLISADMKQKRTGNASIAFMQLPVTAFLNQLAKKYNTIAQERNLEKIPSNHEFLEARIPCRLTYIDNDKGKMTPHWGINVFLENDRFLELLSYYLPEPFEQAKYAEFKEFLRSNPKLIDEFADMFVVTMPRPRIKYYEVPNIQVIRGYISKYLGEIEESLGFFPVYVRSELLYDLTNYTRAVLFIGLIFDLIVVLLVIISVLLIYSLLLINIETKTFETGVQRMVGLSKVGLIVIVLVQSFLFVVPAVMSGFLLSIPSLALFSKVLTKLLNIDVQTVPTNSAIFQALFIGIVIPSLSSIIPINVALAKNLNDALDYQRSKTQAVFMEVLQKGKRNLTGILSFGFFSCAYGISIYYLLPLALLSFNLSLILRIFIFILFGMLFALTLIALNTQRLFEIAFTYLFLWREKESAKIMVLKNLMGHRSRNRLTTIIYSLGLGFIIFLNVAYKVQLETLRLHEMRTRAGYLELQVDSPKYALSPRVIEPIIKNHTDIIENFSWIPFELKKLNHLKMKNTKVSDYSRTGESDICIYGVQPNLFEATHKELLDIDYYNRTSELGILEQLYTARGSQSAGFGSLVTQRVSADPLDYKQTLLLDMHSSIKSRMYEIRPMFTMRNAPGFTMTDMELAVTTKQSMMISLPMYAHFARSKISELPLQKLIIKLKDNQNKDHIKVIKKVLQDTMDESGLAKNHYIIGDTTEDDAAQKDIEIILSAIFGVVIPITMFLCFFSLSASMSANLYEQTKEIGVLRAIGFESQFIVRLYVYEAFILVISSSLLGVFIGTFVGWIMTLQQGMFLQLPLTFIFPHAQFIQISCFSILCAILSTYRPTKNVVAKAPAQIIRSA